MRTRGYVRYQLVRSNLEPYVSGGPLKIADVGGGSGIDALWLAELGHAVDIIEPAVDQLKIARARIAKASPGVQKRINLIQATAKESLKAGGKSKYDLVLSHGVVMYLDDPAIRTKELVQLTKPGGHISLLEKGFAASQQRLIQETKWSELRELTQTGRCINNMGLRVHAFKPTQLRQMLTEAGARVITWRGVRVMSDRLDLSIKSLDAAVLERLIAIERKQGVASDTRGLGQMLHFIAQR